MCVPGTVETVRDRVEREGAPRMSRRVALAAGAGALTACSSPRTGSPPHDQTRSLITRSGGPGAANAAAHAGPN
jgi:NAD(P)H-hydrate repair Nnr-like enzyme with NAD(P)H-hydrate dehydratase domain